MFGALVDDWQTIEFYLQKMLLDKGYSNYEVINCSVTWNLSLPKLFSEEVSSEDIVVIMSHNFNLWKSFEKENTKKVKCLESMSQIWNEIEEPVDCIYNMVCYCNYIVNQKIAEKIFRDINESLNIEIKGTICKKQL